MNKNSYSCPKCNKLIASKAALKYHEDKKACFLRVSKTSTRKVASAFASGTAAATIPSPLVTCDSGCNSSCANLVFAPSAAFCSTDLTCITAPVFAPPVAASAAATTTTTIPTPLVTASDVSNLGFGSLVAVRPVPLNPAPSVWCAGVDYDKDMFDSFRVRNIYELDTLIDNDFVAALGPFKDLDTCLAAIQDSNKRSFPVRKTSSHCSYGRPTRSFDCKYCCAFKNQNKWSMTYEMVHCSRSGSFCWVLQKMQPLHADHLFDNTYAKIMKSPLNRSIPVELMTVALSMFRSKISICKINETITDIFDPTHAKPVPWLSKDIANAMGLFQADKVFDCCIIAYYPYLSILYYCNSYYIIAYYPYLSKLYIGI